MPKHSKRKLKKSRARRRTLRGGTNTGNKSRNNSRNIGIEDLAKRLKKAESSPFQRALGNRFGLDNKTGLHTFLSKLKDSTCDITDETRRFVEEYINEISKVNRDNLINDLYRYQCFSADDKKNLSNRLFE